ncbi:exodeoxyribonuclease I [Ditylenchus destructor]|uniref:Exodeoxyribonuclease I n=1 Tax=Ditylenchus destructor TaxID=166010 RepID=A0AAD4MJS4_9BILA|nr:exodeoxyribonuclease I [Ditylenchus destructor]
MGVQGAHAAFQDPGGGRSLRDDRHRQLRQPQLPPQLRGQRGGLWSRADASAGGAVRDRPAQFRRGARQPAPGFLAPPRRRHRAPVFTPALNEPHFSLARLRNLRRGAAPRPSVAVRGRAHRRELNEVGEPLMIYCKPAPDYLPSPEACLITGITPQLCLERGVPEHEFRRADRARLLAARHHRRGLQHHPLRRRGHALPLLAQPDRSVRPRMAERMRPLGPARRGALTYALRPDGIEWPEKEDGKPSFKLEDLARANGLLHESAHDALSDVRATIALARLIRSKQPKLFDFAFGLHRKDRVATELGLPATRETAKPFLHVSGMFPVERGCLAVMWPLASHPTNKNELLAWDLATTRANCATSTSRRCGCASSPAPRTCPRCWCACRQGRAPQQVADGRRQPAHARGAHGRALGRRPGGGDAPRGHRARPARHERDLVAGICPPQGGHARRRRGPVRRLRRQCRPAAPEPVARPLARGTGKDRTGFDDGRLEELLFRYRARTGPNC